MVRTTSGGAMDIIRLDLDRRESQRLRRLYRANSIRSYFSLEAL